MNGGENDSSYNTEIEHEPSAVVLRLAGSEDRRARGLRLGALLLNHADEEIGGNGEVDQETAERTHDAEDSVELGNDDGDKTTNSPITIFKETDFRGSQIWFGYDINSIYTVNIEYGNNGDITKYLSLPAAAAHQNVPKMICNENLTYNQEE